jgi:hypothetical protein
MLYRALSIKVDPFDAANALSWKCLLGHRPKGLSLLQKWERAYRGFAPALIADAMLITNRRPDAEFEQNLATDGRRVNWQAASATTRAQVIAQLGDEQRADFFFSVFEFRHHHQGYDSLDRLVLDRLVPRHHYCPVNSAPKQPKPRLNPNFPLARISNGSHWRKRLILLKNLKISG